MLFIGGLGRSGSTVLDMLLTGVPGVVSIGEVRHLWARGLRDNSLCACGLPFHDCPFWGEVGERAFGGWDSLDPDEAIATARKADRHRQLLQTAAHAPIGRERLERYAALLQPLFEAVQAITGANLIVDSSKDGPQGFALRSVPGIDLRAVHLVRDSRGVAFSWTKSVQRPDDTTADGQLMSRMSPGKTALMWLDQNMLLEVLGRSVPTTRVRYEDLMAKPDRQLRRIFQIADITRLPQRLLDESDVRPVENHAIAGNPVRFSAGKTPLVLDEQWRTELPGGQRRLVTSLTAPMLRRYGYIGTPERKRLQAI